MDEEKHQTACTAPPTAVDGPLPYSPPRVILYREEELQQQLGPVKACASFGLWSAPQRPRESAPSGDSRFQFEV